MPSFNFFIASSFKDNDITQRAQGVLVLASLPYEDNMSLGSARTGRPADYRYGWHRWGPPTVSRHRLAAFRL
ncbi:MAG: hypothetical protein LBJ61_11420 [Deltaproteobacteria bacterium]|nr:hypothetical protein [Deltaproteobacteria bacterium]